MTAYAYTRVSSAGQAASGLGIEAQQATITTCAKGMGVEVAAWFSDAGISGGKGIDDEGKLDLEKRPGLMQAMAALEKGDVLIVANRTRLARDQLLAKILDNVAERRGARIISAAGEGTDDDSATSKLIRGIIDLVSEYQRAVIRLGVKGALAAKKARGERVAQIPYGYRLAPDGKMLEPDPHEQAGLARMRTLKDSGATMGAIAQTLASEGYSPKAGRSRKGLRAPGEWNPKVVSRLLARAV